MTICASFSRSLMFSLSAMFLFGKAVLAVESSQGVDLICMPEYPIVFEGENVKLQAWVSKDQVKISDDAIAVKWRIDDGRILAEQLQTEWLLSSIKLGRDDERKLNAKVTVGYGDLAPLECELEVILAKVSTPSSSGTRSIRGDSRFSSKIFLSRDDRPPQSKEYGLYSYVLFISKSPEGKNLDRVRSLLAALFDEIQDVDQFLAQYIPASSLNVTFIPVTEAPKAKDLIWERSDWIEKTLTAYDTGLAEVLLSGLDLDSTSGPYIVALRNPLQMKAQPNDQDVYTILNLSGQEPEVIRAWVKSFKRLAAKERSWTDETLNRFRLQLRNLIAIGGSVTDTTLANLSKIIQFGRYKVR